MDLFGAPSIVWLSDGLTAFAVLVAVSITGSAVALHWLRNTGNRTP